MGATENIQINSKEELRRGVPFNTINTNRIPAVWFESYIRYLEDLGIKFYKHSECTCTWEVPAVQYSEVVVYTYIYAKYVIGEWNE
jgi:hypothetical protein